MEQATSRTASRVERFLIAFFIAGLAIFLVDRAALAPLALATLLLSLYYIFFGWAVLPLAKLWQRIAAGLVLGACYVILFLQAWDAAVLRYDALAVFGVLVVVACLGWILPGWVFRSMRWRAVLGTLLMVAVWLVQGWRNG